jgi:hypothetical protein
MGALSNFTFVFGRLRKAEFDRSLPRFVQPVFSFLLVRLSHSCGELFFFWAQNEGNHKEPNGRRHREHQNFTHAAPRAMKTKNQKI